VNTINFIVIAIFVGLIFSYPTLIKIILIYRTPIYRINMLPESGQVLVVGKADVQNTKSPLKRKNCSLWQVEIQGFKFYPWRRHHWGTIYSQTSQDPFELDDRTGKIQIFPANAQLVLHDDFHKAVNFLSPLPPRIKSAIESLGIITTDVTGFEKQLRVSERIVKPGDEIYILGEVQYENGSKVIKKGSKSPFIISDHREDEVLSTLFKQVILNFVIAIIIVVVGFVVLNNQ